MPHTLKMSEFALPNNRIGTDTIGTIAVEVARRKNPRATKTGITPSGIYKAKDDDLVLIDVSTRKKSQYVTIPAKDLRTYLAGDGYFSSPKNKVGEQKLIKYIDVAVAKLEKDGWITELADD